jgi:hypothetical protein
VELRLKRIQFPSDGLVVPVVARIFLFNQIFQHRSLIIYVDDDDDFSQKAKTFLLHFAVKLRATQIHRPQSLK